MAVLVNKEREPEQIFEYGKVHEIQDIGGINSSRD